MASAPVSYDAGTGQTESMGNLRGPDEVVEVVAAAHRRRLYDTGEPPLSCDITVAGAIVSPGRARRPSCTCDEPGSSIGNRCTEDDMSEADNPRALFPSDAASERFLARWGQLREVERQLVVLAMEAMTAGEFPTFTAWQLFFDVATDLVVLVETGVITVEQVHAAALDAARAASGQ